MDLETLIAAACAIQGTSSFCPARVAGVYSTTYGTMALTQSGSAVTGTYGIHSITGSVSGNTLIGTWIHNNGDGRSGPLEFEFTESGFSGWWSEEGRGQVSWSGTRQ